MRNLTIFLAKFIADATKVRYEATEFGDSEEFRKHIMLKFPIIQGIEAQSKIEKLASLDLDHSQIGKELEEFLKGQGK